MPQTVILPMADLLQAFYQACGDSIGMLSDKDVWEILSQIIVVLLDNDEKSEEQLRKLPELDRLVYFNRIDNPALFARTQQFAGFRHAVHVLAFGVRQRLVELGAYTNEGFPYFLDRFIGPDVMLTHLPF